MVVSNTIANPNRTTSIWTRVWRLGRYVLGLDLGHANEKCLDAFGAGFFGITPEQKIYEMQIAASAAKHSNNPVYHQVLSWPENEQITPSRFREIFQDYVDFYKLHNAQIIAGLHQDTDNFHIHFVVNRFDIQSNRMVQINNGFDRFHAARFCCYLEDKYGYAPSENAAAYKIGDEIVLSDLYNADSSRGQIKKKSVAFGSESVSQNLRKIVGSLLSEVNTWQEFQTSLLRFDVSLRPGLRDGLVYCYKSGSEDVVNVAASRVSKMATRRALRDRFGADFDESFVPPTARASEQLGASVFMAVDIAAPLAEVGEYQRYSDIRLQPAAPDDALANTVDQLSTLFPMAHVLFDQPVRGEDVRVHVLDRTRGDSQPLTKSELIRFTPNLNNLLRRGRKLRLVPSAERSDEQNYALIGPAAALNDLHARGLFPAVVQEDDDGSRFVFCRVTAEDAERLWLAGAEANCRLERNPSLLLGARMSPVPVKIDPVHLEAPELLTRLLRPRRLQFTAKISERLSDLRALLDLLGAVAQPRPAARRKMKLLKSFSGWLGRLKSKGDMENARKTADQSDRGELSAELRSTFVRSRGIDQSVQRNAGGGERQRADVGNIPRADRSARSEQEIDLQFSAVAREPGERWKPTTEGVEQYSENTEHAKSARQQVPADAGAAKHSHSESEAFAPRARTAILRPPGGHKKLTSAWRMLLCLKSAHRHGLQARWDTETKDSIGLYLKADGDRSGGERVACVMGHAIELGPRADRDLIEDLRSALDLPVILLSATVNPEAKTPAFGADEHDHEAEHDARAAADIGRAADLHMEEFTPASVLHPKPKPRFLVFDPEGLWASEALEEGEARIGALDALVEYDLSEVTDCLLLVSNQLALAHTRDLEMFESRAREAGLPEHIEIQAQMPASCAEISPQILVLLISEDQADEPQTAGENDKAVICHFSDNKIYGGRGIALNNLTDVLIYDLRSPDEIEHTANITAQDIPAALQDRLESLLASIDRETAQEAPKFHYPDPNDDLEDELNKIWQPTENNFGFSM